MGQNFEQQDNVGTEAQSTAESAAKGAADKMQQEANGSIRRSDGQTNGGFTQNSEGQSNGGYIQHSEGQNSSGTQGSDGSSTRGQGSGGFIQRSESDSHGNIGPDGGGGAGGLTPEQIEKLMEMLRKKREEKGCHNDPPEGKPNGPKPPSSGDGEYQPGKPKPPKPGEDYPHPTPPNSGDGQYHPGKPKPPNIIKPNEGQDGLPNIIKPNEGQDGLPNIIKPGGEGKPWIFKPKNEYQPKGQLGGGVELPEVIITDGLQGR